MTHDDDRLLTAQQRLAISRRALLDQLQHRHAPTAPRSSVLSLDFLDRSAWGSVARRMAERWWRRHPANAAGQLARPVLERLARDRPFGLVAVAAAVGAAAFVIRPWRLLSVTAVLAAVLKSSDVADVVTTLMQRNAGRAGDG